MIHQRPTIPEGVKTQFFEPTVTSADNPRLLVLVNGIGAGVDNWGSFPECLDRLSYAIDVSGAKSCEKWPSMAKYSRAVIETLDAIDPDVHMGSQPESGKVDILGLSWGGALVQETAVKYGDRLGSIVLAMTIPGLGSIMPKPVAIRALSSPDRTSPKFMEIAGDVYGGDVRRDPSLLAAAGITRKIDREAYDRQKRAVMTWPNSLRRLRRIDNPALVIGGKDDPIAHPINAKMIAWAIRGSELELIPEEEGGGHLFLHTRPQESADIVVDFLDRHR